MPKPINISASRGAAILGVSKYQTPVEIWLQIMEDIEPGFCEDNNYALSVVEDNAAMRWGIAFESAIIDLAEKKNNQKIVFREKFFEIDIFITCHIDGSYTPCNHNSNILHEGKTTTQYYFKDNFGESGTDQVPIEYQIQCQHQMICTGANEVILSVLVFPKRPEEWENEGWHIDYDNHITSTKEWAKVLNEMGYFHQYKIKAHKELQDNMIHHYTEWWNTYVIEKIPPQVKTYNDIKLLVRDPVGTIVASETVERLMNEYNQIKSEIGNGGTLHRRMNQIKTHVLDWMNISEKIIDDDSQNKFILRDRAGKKLASYYKDKNGRLIFK